MSSPRRAVMYTGGFSDLCNPLHSGNETVEWRIYKAVGDGDGPSLQTPQGKIPKYKLLTHNVHVPKLSLLCLK